MKHIKGEFCLNELLYCRYKYKFLEEEYKKGEGIAKSGLPDTYQIVKQNDTKRV